MWASSNSGGAAPPVGLTTNAGGKPVTRVFGQPLDPESVNAPGSLLKLIQYLQKRGKNTPGLFRKPTEDIRKEVEALRKGVMLEKDQLQVATYTNSPFTAAEVMRQWLEALPDPLLTCDLYDSFLIALTFTELEDRLDYWRLLLAALPPGFKATTEKTLSILHLLHTHSTGQFPANGNYAQNLGPIFASIFLRPRAVGPHMAHDAKLTADVVQNLIEHMPSLFDPAQMSTIHNTPRRPASTPVSTPMKLAALPRSLRSSAPSSPTSPTRSTTTLPSSSVHSLSSLMPEHKYPKMPAIIKPPTPKRRRHVETASSEEGAAKHEPAAAQEKGPELADDGAADNTQDTTRTEDANGTPHNGGAGEEDSVDQTASQEQPDAQPMSDEHVEETRGEADLEDEEDSGGTAESVNLSGQYDANTEGVAAPPSEEAFAKEKGLDEQVARIERACEDLTCHLYDAAMTFDRALSTARSLRTLCEDITQFFQRTELELPQGNLSDEENIAEDEQDESKLLLLITQIKHFMGQAQANTQLLIDAYEQSEEGELDRRRLLASFVQEVATRVHTIVHPTHGA